MPCIPGFFTDFAESYQAVWCLCPLPPPRNGTQIRALVRKVKLASIAAVISGQCMHAELQ